MKTCMPNERAVAVGDQERMEAEAETETEAGGRSKHVNENKKKRKRTIWKVNKETRCNPNA